MNSFICYGSQTEQAVMPGGNLWRHACRATLTFLLDMSGFAPFTCPQSVTLEHSSCSHSHQSARAYCRPDGKDKR